ncbi:MAG: hypothetical protein JSV86_18390 [Gemmatimonadota bacterium]|nr:MAG: hypothetical protein JSV86_18390 [Gemmatimonadota bacterium]
MTLVNWLYHAFLWEDGVMTDLGSVTESAPSYVEEFNNCG